MIDEDGGRDAGAVVDLGLRTLLTFERMGIMMAVLEIFRTVELGWVPSKKRLYPHHSRL